MFSDHFLSLSEQNTKCLDLLSIARGIQISSLGTFSVRRTYNWVIDASVNDPANGLLEDFLVVSAPVHLIHYLLGFYIYYSNCVAIIIKKLLRCCKPHFQDSPY